MSGRATADIRRPVPLIVGFLAPAVILYTLFFVAPMARSVFMSLYRGSPQAGLLYVGGENYQRLATDPMFWTCVRHNLAFVVFGGVATIVLALALAIGLTRCGRGRDFFRVVFLFPNVMAAVAVAVLWSFIYNPSFGVLNGILRGIGLPTLARAWLGEPSTAMPAIIFIQVWMQAGFYMVLFYAGLLRIPTDYIEAARIDGVSFLQELRHITLPLLSEILRIAFIYIVINSLNVFALVYLVNEGQSNKYNYVLLTYLYDQAFKNGNYGYACAIAVAMLVVVLAIAALVNQVFRRREVEL